MQQDDPPSLPVGTAVSAKYKGAFCEAKVSKVVRVVKCKVTYKNGLGTATVGDDVIRGTLRVGQLVQVRHPERKEIVDATITKIQDCSQYTVVFDDGDITTLRRTALCLKSGRHFNESETLDQLPLTHPEHFGNPVVGGRRGRRSRQMKEDSSEGETEEKNEPDLELYSGDVGRVVVIEASDKKRGKDNWFPGLIVVPSAQPTVRINMKDEFLVRSFKDGRYYTVPKKEVQEFTREMGMRVESNALAEAVEKTLKYLDSDELPVHWERSSLFNVQNQYSDSEENFSDDSTDETYEEKDHFVAQLYKFMDDSGTPLNKSPTIGNRDVDLYRLFRLVEKLGGYNRVTNQNKWRTIANRLKFSNSLTQSNQVKSVYKKFLLSYESFHRTLGVTMLNHSRTAKKNRGRSLIRDRDRATPMNSPKPEKEDSEVEKKDEEKVVVGVGGGKVATGSGGKVVVKEEDSSDDDEQSEQSSSGGGQVGRPRRVEKKPPKVKSEKGVSGEESDDKVQQQTRSKSTLGVSKSTVSPVAGTSKDVSPKRELKTPTSDSSVKSVEKKEEKKRGRKRINPEDKAKHSESTRETPAVNVGDKLKVYYGPTHESKVTYEAKVIEIEKDASGPIYLVHYTGWNTRYDEWIQPQRIAENLSAATKAKRLKQNSGVASSSKTTPTKPATKRGRGTSITGRSASTTTSATPSETTPRSTTPSSVTSSSSRTKSPAVPKSGRVSTRGRTRRISVQTDPSIHSETDSDASESETEPEPELTRTRSGGGKGEEGLKVKKSVLTKSEKRKDDEDTEKEDEPPEKIKRPRRINTKSADETDDDSTNPPKGRDFDLNQIRSELKGITKVVKVASTDSSEREVLSSDDSNLVPDKVVSPEEVEEKKVEEKSPPPPPPPPPAVVVTDDIYEFKEPEPFEFDDKSLKKRLTPRLFEDAEKSPKKREKKSSPAKTEISTTPEKRSNKKEEEEKKIEDPFDKLVESPSFRIVKSVEKSPEKPKVVRNIILDDEPLSLFKDLDEDVEDPCVDRLLISDNDESQSQPLFSSGDDNIFTSETFAKTVTECPTLNLNADCLGFKDDRKKDSDDDEALKDTIQRITQSTMTDEESSDGLLMKKNDEVKFSAFGVLTEKDTEVVKETPKISPALQESDTSLMKVIYEPQPELLATKLEETKDINIKTGAKVAESILQKFSMLKQQTTAEDEPTKPVKEPTKPKKNDKRSRKYVSPEFVDSDSDSSDSEQLIIARSDDESQEKPDSKLESDSNISFPQPDESQSQEATTDHKPETKDDEPDSNLHSLLLCEETIPGSPAPETTPPATREETTKQQQQPPPPPSQQKGKSLMEMPFASVPSSSGGGGKSVVVVNSGSVMVVKEKIVVQPPVVLAPPPPPPPPPLPAPPSVAPPLVSPQAFDLPVEGNEIGAVSDNSPPTTPESSISNLSPRGENGGLSPPSGDNDSGKSMEADDFTSQHRNTNKMSPYSEEDTLSNAPDTAITTSSTTRKEQASAAATAAAAATVGKKRRRSFKGASEEAVAPPPPVKRGRRPASIRSRQNSDSDDTSEHSATGSTVAGPSNFERRSPRPAKYNYIVDLDPSLDSAQRIAVLIQKIAEVRKTYADVKAELAVVERRRKKIRRREREALKAAKQEVIVTITS